MKLNLLVNLFFSKNQLPYQMDIAVVGRFCQMDVAVIGFWQMDIAVVGRFLPNGCSHDRFLANGHSCGR